MTTDEQSAEKTYVKTYVPTSQKDEWATHADELDMSQSEFVRTMVQAGRRDFQIPSMNGTQSTVDNAGTTDDDFEDRILAVIEREGVLDWDGLVDRLIDDVEDDVDAALGRLQDENRIRYSGREGGYVLTNDE
ncbi:DUF5805 domain-containing protein [Natronolimnohabitans innermongolicus]|uniref:Uncharacterized protein n=1 Tax=Natronolimnohabitans innermongolicus JCM 12255 TaxID=1227499 RepID=L9XLE8_9EURY|nr:DUF5805 domain-containing protein [Natronolimnohabitans innermongolicus]ELY62231.1 hypothetical protein C493_00340 [Natronolimnohabitans innermongolicus JCM 12255]